MANIKKDFAPPNGPILLLSAKGSTTAGIAEANGVKDFSGNGNHGQAYGGVTVNNNVYVFNGTTSSDYLSITLNSGLSSSQLTYSTKVKIKGVSTTSSHLQVIFGHTSSNMLVECDFHTDDNKVFYSLYDSSNTRRGKWTANATNVGNGEEHTITVTYDKTKLILYIDGAFFEQMDLTVDLPTSSRVVLIGSVINAAYSLNAEISDIRIYPRALSAAEVKYLHNGFQPNIIMGQTIPSGAILDLSARGLTTSGIAQANGVVDRSGNGNHGQAYNGVAIVNDDEMGSCFSLVNVSGNSNLQYCQFDLTDTDVFSIRNEITITTTILFRKDQLNFICGCGTTGNVGLWLLVSIRGANSSVVNFNAGNLGQQEFTLLDLVLDKFYVITVTLNSNKELSLFIDGIFISSKTLSGDISTCGNPIRVGNITTPGSTVGARLLDGEIESLRIYPRALTASEVQQLANASLKKITNIKKGSSEIKNIYYGSNLVYAKTEDYVSSGLYRIGSIQLSSVSRVCIKLHNGDYAMTDWGNHCIRIYDSAGNLKTSFGSQGYGDGLFANPYGICEDPDGYLYTSDWRGQNSDWYIQKLYYNGDTVSFVDKLSMSGGASQIIYAPGRDCILANTYGGGTIYQISRDLSSKTAIYSGIYLPIGVGMSSDGKTLYATSYGGYLYRATYASAASTSPSSSGRILTIGSGGTAQGIALSDDNSYLLLVNNTDKNIQKVNLSDNTNSVLISDMYAFCIMNNGGNFFTFIGGPSDSIYPYKLLM